MRSRSGDRQLHLASMSMHHSLNMRTVYAVHSCRMLFSYIYICKGDRCESCLDSSMHTVLLLAVTCIAEQNRLQPESLLE